MDYSLTSKQQVKICPTHRNPVDYIDIFDNTNSPFNCIRCARDKNIKLEGLLRFSELLDEDDFDFLTNFPPLEESIQQKMREVSKISNRHEGILQNIDDYFKDIQAQIDNYLNSSKNQAKDKAIKLLKSNEDIFKIYNNVSFRKELRQVLQEGGEEMENKVCQILAKVVNKEDINRNSQTIGKCLDENKSLRESVNFQIPNKIKSVILNLISSIDFFSSFDEQQFENAVKLNHEPKVENDKDNGNSNCNLLMDLIGSSFNFCQEEFLIKTRKMIETLSSQINSHDLGNNPYQTENRTVLQKLNQNQMSQILKLSKKIGEVSEAYSQMNIPEEEINSKIQPKTWNFISTLNSLNQKELKLLFKQYPVIELSHVQTSSDISILSKLELIKSTFEKSQNLIITKENNGHLSAQHNGNQGICYFNFILDKTKQYIIRFQLFQNQNNSDNALLFGIIPDSQKDSNWFWSFNMTYDERNNNFSKMNKIVRGGIVAKGNGKPIKRELEVRICLQKKIFKVSEYPDYSCICEIDDPQKIQSEVAYRFGVQLWYPSSKITITELKEASLFDEKM